MEASDPQIQQEPLNSDAHAKPADQSKHVPSEEELQRVAQEMQVLAGEGDGGMVDLIIVDLNAKELPLKVSNRELIVELRDLLSEHVYTCFFTNYILEHDGAPLNEFQELAELDLAANNVIFMRPDKYNYRSARAHIKRLIDLLENPSQLHNHSQTRQKNKAPRSRSNSHEGAESEHDIEKEIKEMIIKRNQAFQDLVVEHQKDEIKLPQDKQLSKNAQVTKIIKELNNQALAKGNLNKLKHVKCIESIQFSHFNPVSPQRAMQGDLLYLAVRTLENPSQEHVITCSVNGFYKNDSTEKGVFNPGPTTRGNPCYSYNLVGTLHQLSPQFSANLQTYINSILQTDPYFLTKCQLFNETWLAQDSSKRVKVSSAEDLSQTLVPLHGLDPQQSRDWNEEFQIFKTIGRDSFLQRMQVDRNVTKTYNDFMEAAKQGAMAIVDGKLQALNATEPRRTHVFVFNQIFFSFAIDCPTNYIDLTSKENNPSFTQSNHDLSGLRLVCGLDIAGLHNLATCVVNYKGHRVLCQSIIPGILNNQELSSMAEYGMVDDKKAVVANPDFHTQILQVAQALSIKVNKVIDPSTGNEVEIAGSVEVKGIKGSDKRHYIVDMQGMTPRDANYLGVENHTALVRPELINIYQKHKNMQYAGDRMEGFTKQIQEEREAERLKEEQEGIEITEEVKNERAKKRIEQHQRQIKEVERLLQEAPQFTFNVNVFKSNVKLALSEEELKIQEDEVRDLAKFLIEKAVPGIINDMKVLENVPTDSNSLEAFFHSHGVNMRYLGKALSVLISQSKDTANVQPIHQGKYKHIRAMLERDIFFRSLKHVFTRILREESGETDMLLSNVVCHVLNCIFAPTPMLAALNAGDVKYEDDTIQSKFYL